MIKWDTINLVYIKAELSGFNKVILKRWTTTNSRIQELIKRIGKVIEVAKSNWGIFHLAHFFALFEKTIKGSR